MIKEYKFTENQTRSFGVELLTIVYRKFDYRCCKCSGTKRLSIHHIDGRGSNYVLKGLEPNNDVDNLELVCEVCHGRIHAERQFGDRWKEFGGYIKTGREKEWSKEWRMNNPEKVKARKARYNAKHAEKIKARRKQKYAENREKYLEKSKQWQADNAEHMRTYRREYARKHRAENLEKIRKYQREYQRALRVKKKEQAVNEELSKGNLRIEDGRVTK